MLTTGWVCLGLYLVSRIAYRAGGLGLIGFEIGFNWLKLGLIGFELGLFGFVFEASAEAYIDIIHCYSSSYVHSGIQEIGFVLHKKVFLCDRPGGA